VLLIEYLLFLDPQGPIRIKDLALHIDGIGDYFASQALQGAEATAKAFSILELILSYNFIQVWNDVCVTLTERGGQEAVLTLQKAREIFYKKEKGFGITRCLYELNPTLCCQSPLIVNRTALTIFHLLDAMENCESLPENEILDEHMWAFLASRLELTVNVQLTKIQKYPELISNACIQTLSILSLAQEASNGVKLKNIPTLFNQWLHTVVDVYHSRTIRYELSIMIKRCAERGSLAQLLRTVIDTKFILRDRIGFKRAVRQYQVNKLHMMRLTNSKVVYKVGYRYGLQLSVIVSFLIAALTAIILMTKSL
jgi:hypothetical protein